MKKLYLKKETNKLNFIQKTKKKEFITSVSDSLITPISYMKFCYLCKPFFYPGSHIGRYSITLLFDAQKSEHAKFLEKLEKLAVENAVDSLGYLEGDYISIKFQTKDQPEIFALYKGKKKEERIILDHDLPEGFYCCVHFDLNTYFNKKTNRNGFNFCPRKIIFHLDQKERETESEVIDDEDHTSGRNRPRTKNNGVRNSELQPEKKRSMGIKLRDRPNPRKNKRD